MFFSAPKLFLVGSVASATLDCAAYAFVSGPVLSRSAGCGGNVCLAMATAGGETKKPLTSADILARARKAAGMEDEEMPAESAKLFDDDLLDDMQNCLLHLEKRVRDGPGSLTAIEVSDFSSATQRIIDEMNAKVAAGDASGSIGKATTFPVAPPAEAQTMAFPSFPAPSPAPEPIVAADTVPKVIDTNPNDEEGAAYDGEGGMGLAQGTRNTYIIPGMDEMTPVEYRAALQQSVIDRQSKRQDERSGVVGNRAALQYLDHLGYGGASNNWAKKGESEDVSGVTRVEPNKFKVSSNWASKDESKDVAVPEVARVEPKFKPVPAPAPAPVYKTNPVQEVMQEVNANEARELVDKVMDTNPNDEEGAAYNGEGGLGLAQGTRNTYIIPGMDEMTPEEYRAALQQSVIDRQSKRQDERRGVVGNRAALQYLDQLGYGGASANWDKNSDSEDN